MSIRVPLAIVMLALAACRGAVERTEPASEEHTAAGADVAITRVAFGSCAFQWAEQPIFRTIVAAEPDLYLSLGDAIYGDFDGEKAYDVTPESLRGEWAKLAASPDWQHLVAHVPVMATWDNHDYGHHSAGAEFPLKAKAQEIFLDFFGEPVDSERRSTPGVYTAKTFGPAGRRVQIILLDTRFFKGTPELVERPEGAGGSLGKYAPQTDPEVTLLGEAQWEWLADQLRQPAELRLIASSGQIVPDDKGMDEWGNYPHERQRLFELIESAGVTGVIFLTGNVHFSEVSRNEGGFYPLYDFTSSGLTHINEEYPQAANSYRVAGPVVDLNFGLVEIDWEARPSPVILLRIVGVESEVLLEHRISLDELRVSPEPTLDERATQ